MKRPFFILIRFFYFVLRLLIKYIRLTPLQHILLVEAFFFLFFSKLILLFYPLKKIAPRLGELNQELNKTLSLKQKKTAEEIRISVSRISRFVPWRSVCIDQAITGLKMLSRRGIPVGLCLGVKKDLDQKKLLAHAWIVCGDRILIGGKHSAGFKLVSNFVRNHK